MITAKMTESTFNSRWLRKKGIVRIKARRELGVNILVQVNDDYYVKTISNIPWKTATMLLRNPSRTADALIFQEQCVVADNEIWLLQDSNSKWYTIHCLTNFDYREGLQLNKTLSREEMVKAIEEEPPF